MEKQFMLEKIKKLLALATSPNEHEAALAMEKASELLAKHNLSMADMQNDSNTDPKLFIVNKEMGKRVPKWIQIMYLSVSRVFDCELLVEKHYNRMQTYMIIGQKDDIEMTKHFCKYFIQTIPQIAKQTTIEKNWDIPRYLNTKEKNDFIYGATITIINRLKKMYAKMSETKCTALVLANKKKIVSDYIANNFRTKTSAINGKQRISREAYMAGVSAGNNMPIHTPIKGCKPTAQLN